MLLEKLSNACGVAGGEGEVREAIMEEIRGHVTSTEIDALGNLVVFKEGRGKSARVLLAAHMDEVGLMVTYIEKSGYLRFNRVGGIPEKTLLAKLVLIGRDKIPGVVGVKPIHLLQKKEQDRVIKQDEMYIDIGVSSREEAEKSVKLGDYAAFGTRFEDLGDIVKGKALDDRIGCAVLVEMLKGDLPISVTVAFSVQEEVGLRGARTVGFRTEPEIAIVVEGTAAADFPQKKDLSRAPLMGGGPALTHRDRATISDPELVRLFVAAAEENGIPYQFKQPNIGGTDAGRIHLAKGGARSMAVAVPCRYIHSPVSFAHKKDIEHAGRLLRAVLKKL